MTFFHTLYDIFITSTPQLTPDLVFHIATFAICLSLFQSRLRRGAVRYFLSNFNNDLAKSGIAIT